MTSMGRYCKAYSISALRAYPRWSELARTDVPYQSVDDNEPYLFVHDNFTVTTDVFPDEGIVFDAVDAEWESFCRDVLEFCVPEECSPLEDGPTSDAQAG
jgi:hypothetical protein